MAQGDWEPDESDQEWLPGFDVRAVVAELPLGPITFDDFGWDETLAGQDRIPQIREALGDLRGDAAVAEKALSRLRALVCDEGTTSVYGAGVVPSLLRAAQDTRSPLRAELLQLAGDLARMNFTRHESRSELLLTMSDPMFDSWGYLENWAVEAARMMVGRDGDILLGLVSDGDPRVRGRAAYAVVTALPARQAISDALKTRLAVEGDPAAQMILVVSIAQHEKERDLAGAATTWAQTLWSDPLSPNGIRLGGAIAWLGLTEEPVPQELQAGLDGMPVPVVDELLRQLPWIWWLSHRPARVANWWQDLTR